MQCHIVISWILSTLFLIAGVACITVGMISNSWWVHNSLQVRTEKGLWRSCKYYDNRPDICMDREPILFFEKGQEEIDTVLLVLVASGTFGLLALIASFALLGCRKSHDGWNCGSVLVTLFSFIAGMSSAGSLIFSMVQFEEEWTSYNHGWAFLISWIGCGLFFLAFLVASILICNSSNIKVKRNSRTPPRGGWSENKSYELK